MFAGIAFALLAGCCFAVGAGLFAEVSRRGLPFMLFLSIGAMIGLAISLLVIVDWPAVNSEKRIGEMSLWIIPGALANVAGHLAMSRAMSTGRAPVAWAIGQGGQSVTFIATVLIWNETAGIFSWLGLGLVLAGVALLSQAKTGSADVSPRRGWIFWSLAAMLIYGVNQTLMSVPSHWQGWHDSAHLRLPITLGSIGFAGIMCSLGSDRHVFRRLLPWGVSYGIVICACFAMIYLSLDRLGAAGAAAIAWPLACSMGVVGYAVWEHAVQHRHVTRAEIFGIAVVVAGIGSLAMRK